MPKRKERDTQKSAQQLIPYPVWHTEEYGEKRSLDFTVLNQKDPESFMGYYTQHFFVKVDDKTPATLPISLSPAVGDMVAPAVSFKGVIAFTHDPLKAKFPLSEFKIFPLKDDADSATFFKAMTELASQVTVSLKKNGNDHVKKIADCIRPVIDPDYGNISISIRKNQHGEAMCHVIDQDNKWISKYEEPIKALETSGVIQKGALVKGYLRFGRVVADAGFNKGTIKLDVDLMKIDTSDTQYEADTNFSGGKTTIMTGKKMTEATKDESVAMAMMLAL
tara:strand:+ start:147 stop:980 length:834 start_codon:yes stop_codon:yes gene_type:complete